MAEDPDPIDRLIKKFQKKADQEELFREIFQRFHYPVLWFFRRKGFSDDEAADLTQETFLRMFQSFASYRRDSRFETWLFGVASHVYKNELRRRSAEKRSGREISLDDAYAPVEEPVRDHLAAPEAEGALARLIQEEQIRVFWEALEELPPQMRACCMLRYEKGLKYQEIATLMGVSIETVKAHLHQARKRLMEKLGGAGLWREE